MMETLISRVCSSMVTLDRASSRLYSFARRVLKPATVCLPGPLLVSNDMMAAKVRCVVVGIWVTQAPNTARTSHDP
jgi:hypothetical protein